MYCIKCNRKFTYKEIAKLFWTGIYKKIICPECITTYEISAHSKIIYGVLLGLPVLFINKISILIYIIYAILTTLIFPKFIKLNIIK